jgi:hypothetical protein
MNCDDTTRDDSFELTLQPHRTDKYGGIMPLFGAFGETSPE